MKQSHCEKKKHLHRIRRVRNHFPKAHGKKNYISMTPVDSSKSRNYMDITRNQYTEKGIKHNKLLDTVKTHAPP